MRITNNMIVNDLKENLNTNMMNLAKYQEQLSTGKKINKPSDDPAALVTSLRLRSNITEGEQYLRNIGEAVNFMETTDSALDNINQILQRVKELTVQAANGSNGPDEQSAIKAEILQLNEQLVMIANTTYGSKYIFGGSNVTEAPAQGNKWIGNEQYINLEIGVGVKIPINLNVKAFFGNPDGLDNGGNPDGGLFAVINKLAQDLTGGDHKEIASNLSQINAKINELLFHRSTIGAKVNRLELQQNRLESTQISLTGLLANNEDADMAKVIMELKMQENVYRASLAAGARVIQPSLVDFLR